LPVQILLNNLLYDLSQTGIPFDHVDPEYLEKPRTWKVSEIRKFMVCIGPVSSLFDYATFALMWFVFKANSMEHQSLFQTGWFVESLMTQTLIVHIIRTAKVPFLQSRPSLAMGLVTLGVMGIGIMIPFTPIGSALGMVPLPGLYFAWLAVILVGYCTFTQVIKSWFVGRYGYN